ncbi:MAG TPA: glycosyltransferase family 39 protein [Wenzhouxiangellaceae bacterium]|nr:glycosyltransferase family 39 protein [Wenzhouxiangellaceae bacterium]
MGKRFSALPIAWCTRLEPGRVGLALALLWAAMTMWNFGLPGLHMDEANHYAFIPGMKSESVARLHHYRLPDNYLDRRDDLMQFPILGGSVYNSPITAYLGFPYFAMAGHSVASLRIFSALIGLATILSLAVLVGRIFGWPAALLAGTIIATDPTHVFSVRSQGVPFWPVVLFWALAANFLLTAFRSREPSVWPLIAGGAALGLSVMAYFVGIFMALPLVLAAFIMLRRRPVHLAAFVLAGLLAYSPMIYALISIHVSNPDLLRNFGMPDWTARPSISAFSIENLARLKTITLGALGDHDFATWITGHVAIDLTVPRMLAFALAAGLVILIGFQRRETPARQRVFYGLFGAILALYFSGLFFLKATSLHHLLPITILAATACAGAVAAPGFVRLIATAICSLLIASNLMVLNAAHNRLVETGGRGYHNESYSLVSPLLADRLAEYHPVFAGWGFHLQFLFLTDGRVPYSFVGSPRIDRIDQLLTRHDRLAVVVPTADRETIANAFVAEQELRFAQRNEIQLFSVFLLSTRQN